MAASSSSQPEHVTLSSNPDPLSKIGKKAPSRKGKGKENASRISSRRQGDISADGSKETEDSETPWDWTPLTDPSVSKTPPIFTKDGSYFFSLVGSSVKIHSVATGEVVSTLTPPTATDNVLSSLLTTAILNPHNAFQLITGSLDGRVMVWDFLDAALLNIIDIGQPIHCICAHEIFKDSVFVAASRSSKKAKISGIDDNAAVLRVSLRTVDATTKSAEIHAIGKTRFPTGLTFSTSGAWLIATAGHKVYVASSSSFASGFTKYVSPERLTCLAFHPTEEYFATGDEKGNIRLWYCLSDSLPINARGVEKKTQTTTLHWHAHAVSSIAFTSNGAYLLSGGEESVLVIWQLHTGKKEFVPRVGASIRTVSLSKVGSSEEEYLLGLADATYLFISAGTLKVSRSYCRIKLDPAYSDSPSTSKQPSVPLAIHPLTSTIILPSSHPSSLQIYSPSSSKLVSELEVSPSNRVSRRDEKPIEPSRVEQAIISLSGEWLASVDTRDGEDGFRGEIYLKLWRWDQKTSAWILNTRVDRPHDLKKITCLAFSPSTSKDSQSSLLVTTGEDGNTKTWGLRMVKDKAGLVEEFWVTRSTFNFRSEVPSSASWSPDASLLAISLGGYISIYNPATHILRQTLTSPECKQAYSTHFVGKGGRYLVVVGKHDLILWDLVTQCVRWHHKTLSMIKNLVPHPEDDTFAVFYSHRTTKEHLKTRVSIFHVRSSVPSSIRSIPFMLRNISLNVPYSERSMYTFVGITQDWRVVQFGDDCKMIKEAGSAARGLTSDHIPSRRTLFRDIFGKSAFAEVPTLSSSSVEMGKRPALWTGKEASDTFTSPAYLMPPLEHLFEPLIARFLIPRDQDIAQSRVMEPEEPDVDMEEDVQDPMISGVHQPRNVDQEEMDSFVALFRRHTVTSHPTVTNGQLGDTIKPKANAATRHSASPSPANSIPKLNTALRRKPSGLNPEGILVSPSVSPVNGKKRKNTSG